MALTFYKVEISKTGHNTGTAILKDGRQILSPRTLTTTSYITIIAVCMFQGTRISNIVFLTPPLYINFHHF